MCSDEYVYGVRVAIRVPDPGGTQEWSGTVRLSAQDYDEELAVLPTAEADVLVAFGAGERPGTYTLTVENPGYRTWEQRGISVSEDVCHVNQVDVTVQLEPE